MAKKGGLLHELPTKCRFAVLEVSDESEDDEKQSTLSKKNAKTTTKNDNSSASSKKKKQKKRRNKNKNAQVSWKKVLSLFSVFYETTWWIQKDKMLG